MKLLSRTIKNYLLFSAALVLIFTPLFFFTISHLFIKEMDEVLISHKEDFERARPYLTNEGDFKFFQLMNKEFIVIPSSASMTGDSIYSIVETDPVTKDEIEYRVLESATTLNGTPYHLLIRESLVPSSELIAVITGIQLAMLSTLAVGLYLINRRLSKRIWIPFYGILDRLRRYQIDQESTPDMPAMPTAELRELTEVITQLIRKSHEAYLSQKEFTENASHELQTPLAICRTKLELLAQTKELTSEQAELVGALLDATDRITRLNKNLLLLSKIENRQFLDVESIDIGSIVSHVLGSYVKQAEGKQIKIAVNIARLHVKGNPVLVEVLVGNLISNAIRYTPDDGEILIEGEDGHLFVANSGNKIENPEKLFNRFHRESRLGHGSGLGLSIANKIAEVSGYQLSYDYHQSKNVFRVDFHLR